jgi:hypothetical protein
MLKEYEGYLGVVIFDLNTPRNMKYPQSHLTESCRVRWGVILQIEPHHYSATGDGFSIGAFAMSSDGSRLVLTLRLPTGFSCYPRGSCQIWTAKLRQAE